MTPRPKIMITAGEASGDRLGAGLVRALLRRRPELSLIGMGGEKMGGAGVQLIQDAAEVSVVGIFEVLSHLPAIRRAMRRLEQVLTDERPNLLVPIDFPDFNLRLAKKARQAGVPVVYFVSPQVWAWRRGRVRKIRGLIRRMLVLFPFETGFYDRAGIPVSFVGHPLAEVEEPGATREELLARAGLDRDRPTVALMPGSRRIESSRLLPVMLDAAARLQRARPGLQFLLPLAPDLSEEWAKERAGAAGVRDFVVYRGDFPHILTVCEAGVVAAGTASLEAAVVGLPIVVVYRMSPLSYLVGRTLVRLDDVALPNLVAGRRIVPELIQRECTAPAIERALAAYLDDPDHARRVRAELAEVRRSLGGPGVFDRAAEAVLAELERPG